MTPFEHKSGRFLEWYVDEPLFERNDFPHRCAELVAIPDFEAARALLPKPAWPARQDAVDAYWHAWKLAWQHLRRPIPESGFISNFIDTAFNDCLFLWDSVFILRFGRYGERAFPFHRTLDNFYAKQHPDGYICREIREKDGGDQWNRGCAFGTGPNLFAWAEWLTYVETGDIERLRSVYPALAAYHRWTRKNRSWPDGSYWTTGLGSGMDNMVRVPAGVDWSQEHGWMTWTDATFQAILAANSLASICETLGAPDEIHAGAEAAFLTAWANEYLWDERDGFYYDRDRSGQLLGVKTVGAYWALVAQAVPSERVAPFTEHLNNPASFNRPHRVPSLAADASGYVPEGGDYWRGGVWAPTNYMILQGLTKLGQEDLAHAIAVSHHEAVVQVYRQTGTFWENYDPENIRPGNPAKDDFVGWSGLGPIAVFIEYILGFRTVDAAAGKFVWDIRLTDEFGIADLPVGPTNSLTLHCAKRQSQEDEPEVSVLTDHPVEVQVRWKAGAKTIRS